MANLFRIVGLWLFPLYVFAQGTCTLYSVPHFSPARAAVDLPSPSAAAASYIARWNTALNSAPNNCNSSGQSNHTSYVVTLVSVAPNSASFVVNIQTSRFNWQPSGDVMVCASGQVTQETDTVNISNRQGPCPVPEAAPPACNRPLGQASGSGSDQYSSATYDGGLFCSGGCMVYPSTAGRSPSGLWFANGPLTSTGVSCPPPSAQPSPGDDGEELEPAPAPCPPSTYPGEVNGTSVCVPAVDSTVNRSVTATGTVSTPSGPVTTTTLSTTTTSCVGATCSTRVTTTPSPGGTSGGGGSGVGSTTPPVDTPRDSFCSENPRSPMCKEGRFIGSCSGGFTCDGDAVQCSIAREQHTRNCSVWDGTSPERSLYDDSKVLTGNRTLDLPGNGSFSVGPSSFDQSDAIGGPPGGMSDLSITVMGSSITLPFSRVNSFLQALGAVLVAVSLLLAARIVTRG